MKRTASIPPEMRPNAWGCDCMIGYDTYQIEQSDVGTTRPQYLGQGYAYYKFTQRDVGKHTTVTTPHGTCLKHSEQRGHAWQAFVHW